jgi:hypothetical protein
LLFSNLVVKSFLPASYQIDGFEDFFDKLSEILLLKNFKGRKSIKPEVEMCPVYNLRKKIDYENSFSGSDVTGISVYTGLFGVIVAVAVLYSIKHR